MALKRSQTVTLTGIVIPAGWEHEQVVAIALATADEKERRIASNRKGRELLGYLQRQIEANGVLSVDEKGRDVITIKRYIVI